MDKDFIKKAEELEDKANGVLAVPEDYKPAKPPKEPIKKS
jgi:hypothetical protein